MIAAVCALAGVAVGSAYFATLARNVELFVAGRVVAAVALQGARFVVAVAALFAMARFGLVPLGAGLAGFTLARTYWVRRRR